MNDSMLLRKKVNDLEKLAGDIENSAITLLRNAPVEPDIRNIRYEQLPYHSPYMQLKRETLRKYEQWYLTASSLIDKYLVGQLSDFQYWYSPSSSTGVRDFIGLRVFSQHENIEEVLADFVNVFERQITTILALPSVVDVQEMQLRKIISADLARTEIEEAEMLLMANHYRAAGVIAGVALELHLKTLCDVNNVSHPPKATLDPLANALYKDGKIDVTELKNIQYLASIRNKCSHPNPVAETDARKLVEEVKKIV
jgi:HEPN domain